MQKITVSALVLCFWISGLNAAQTATAPAAGDGSSGSPYQVASIENLYWIYSSTANWTKYYIQTADIDASETSGWGSNGWTPIGNSSTAFTGNYNGQDHTIAGLYISRSTTDYQGLFGYVNATTIQNLNLTNANITGQKYVGGIIGFSAWSSSTITNCSVSGTVSGTGNVGGVIGLAASSTITYCDNTATVTGSGNSVGGVAGEINNGSTLNYCTNSGDVTGAETVGGITGQSLSDSDDSWGNLRYDYNSGSVTGVGHVGGIAGQAQRTITTICYNTGNIKSTDHATGGVVGYYINVDQSNCYNRGNIEGTTYVGGIIGLNETGGTLTNCYQAGTITGTSYIGAISGNQAITITNCYYNNELFTGDAGGGTGKTTTQMKTESITSWGWDTGIWERVDYNYPRLITNPDQSLPVSLTSFRAITMDGSVVLSWHTESETENLGFIIQRKTVGANHDLPSDWTQIASYITDESLQGHGSTSKAHDYNYTDAAVVPGMTYAYRIADVDYSGNATWHSAVEVTIPENRTSVPASFGLQKAYPNPFNPSVTLNYSLPNVANTSLKIYNVLGQEVATLVDAYQNSGNYTCTWQPENLSTGIYLVRLESGNNTKMQKVVFVK